MHTAQYRITRTFNRKTGAIRYDIQPLRPTRKTLVSASTLLEALEAIRFVDSQLVLFPEYLDDAEADKN